jgi:hypothetical protein
MSSPTTNTLHSCKAAIEMNTECLFFPPHRERTLPAKKGVIHPSRNCHGWRHIGHVCWEFCCDSNHFMTHCMCNAWPQRPQTGGESSPGNFTFGAAASNGIRQIPHTSSSISHFHTATQCHRFTLIFAIDYGNITGYYILKSISTDCDY